MNQTPKATLTEGAIPSMLTRLTIPMVFGLFSIIGFNLVDAFFVGQIGTAELAAFGLTFPVVMIMGSIGMGIGMGTSAVVSKAIGQNDVELVRRNTTDSIILAVLFALVFVIGGLLTVEPVFRLLGATEDLLPLIKEYMVIWYLGVIFVIVPMVGSSAIRANGDTKTPAIIMVSMVFINLILDPILIFGWGPIPAMGLQGAAIATVIARMMTLLMGLYVLHFRDRMITFKLPYEQMLESWKNILYIGLPAAASNLVVPVTTAVITFMVTSYGREAIAAYGVASRIDVLAITVLIALSSALAPFIGQNLGAGKLDRIKRGFSLSIKFCLAWGLFMLVVFYFAKGYIAPIFNDNEEVAAIIVLYLTITPIGYGVRGIYSISNTALNVINKPLYASLITILQMFAVYIPMAYLLSSWMGIAGIFWSLAIAYTAGGLGGYLLFMKHLKGIKVEDAPTADEGVIDSTVVSGEEDVLDDLFFED